MKANAVSMVALLIGLLLGGCVQSEATNPAGSSQGAHVPNAVGPATFDESTGAIEGVITDDQLQPIPGAQVGVPNDLNMITLTDVAGHFVFSNVVPGRYALGASALGFTSAAKSVEVVAGEVVSVSLILAPLPIQEPYVELFLFNGMIECGIALIRTTLSAGCDPTQAGSNTHDIYPEGWPTSWIGTMVEAEWDSQANPDWLAFDYNDRAIGYFGVYVRYRGTSPVKFLVERCGDYTKTDFGRAPAPCTDDQVNSSVMHVETFYNGKFQQETHTFDSLCRENVTYPVIGGNALPGYQAGCYGVGPAIQVRWTNYISVFHLELPGDVETYSGRPDG
jgi:hypothetical protein